MQEQQQQREKRPQRQPDPRGCGPLGELEHVVPRPDQQKPRKAMKPDVIGPAETPIGDVTAGGGPREEGAEAYPPKPD